MKEKEENKEREQEQEDNLNVEGTLDDVLKVSVPKKKETK
jgi:hypothetical protein